MTRPNIEIPNEFAINGEKADFTQEKIQTGFDKLNPDIFAGDNINKFIDDTYKGLNGVLDLYNGVVLHEMTTTYDDKAVVGKFIENSFKLYRSLVNDNTGHEVTETEYWEEVALSGGGLEIGDIGIAPLGIDETKGKRRYLNGQLIIQEQYVEFTNKVKSAVALYPSLACSESDWQTTATMTVGGQVGKFVVDDNAGTIRLPKIIMPIQGLTDLSKLAEIVEAGLPNITGNTNAAVRPLQGTGSSGAFYVTENNVNAGAGTGSNYKGLINNFDASRSNSIYGNSNTVQPESIRYPYFIQVATGAETEDNIINEIELNNPYTLFDSKYSPNALYNASWLKSEGQYNSGAVYVTCYEGLLVEYNTDIEVGTTTTLPSGTEYTKKGLSVKLSTETYTDYDYVLNTAEETFRLPLRNGSEDLLSSDFVSIGLGASGSIYAAPANGWYYLQKKATGNQFALLNNGNITSGINLATNETCYLYLPCRKGDIITVHYSLAGATESFGFLYAKGNGSLYYYVGAVAQNAPIVNLGRIEETMATKPMVDGQWVKKPHTFSTATAIGTYTLDLSQVIPNDGYCYELYLMASGICSSASANAGVAVSAFQSSLVRLDGIYSNSSVWNNNSFPMPVGADRVLTLIISQTAFNVHRVWLGAYRRLGTNQ